MATRFQHIVVGAGIEGSWAAYYLARNGLKVLQLEQFPLPHSRGSSHGQSRIIRKAHSDDFHGQLMTDAYREWHKLAKDTGKDLLVETGLLVLGPPCGHTSFDAMVKVLDKLPNSRYEVLTSDQLKQRYPQANYGEEYKALVDYEGGILRADRCVAAVQSMFLKCGGTLRDSFAVQSIEPGKPVVVHGEKESFQADSVVVCAGPWSKKLLSKVGLDLPLTTWRKNVFYWKAEENGFIPTSFVELDAERDCWGLPSLEYPSLVKICCRNQTEADPDDRDLGNKSPEYRSLVEYIKKHYPGVNTTPVVIETCMYTLTPDEVCIMDKHPEHENIVFGCGYSGTGFKIAPAVGQILGDLVTGKSPPYDIKPFALSRFK